MKRHDIHVFDEFGTYNYVNVHAVLPTHKHIDMIEICYLTSGRQRYFVNDQSFDLHGGDVFITFPNEVHGTGDTPEEKGGLFWMVLKDPKQTGDYLGLSEEDATELFRRLLSLPNRLFKGSSECKQLLQKILRVYFYDQGDLTRIELNNLLVAFLLDIIRTGEISLTRSYSENIKSVLQYINKNLYEDLRLEDLANRCNLSLSRFKHLFKKEIGIPPSEYIIRKKIEKSQELLQEQNLSIKDIAFDLGFSSPAYFSTVFKQYKGYSPTNYKIRLSKEA